MVNILKMKKVIGKVKIMNMFESRKFPEIDFLLILAIQLEFGGKGEKND